MRDDRQNAGRKFGAKALSHKIYGVPLCRGSVFLPQTHNFVIVEPQARDDAQKKVEGNREIGSRGELARRADR